MNVIRNLGTVTPEILFNKKTPCSVKKLDKERKVFILLISNIFYQWFEHKNLYQ